MPTARLTGLMLHLGLAAAAAGTGPCLVFGRAELPALRERLLGEAARPQWEELRAHAEGLCTPGSPRYVDPERIDAPREGVRIEVLAHSFGRSLTEVCEVLGLAYQITGEDRYAAHGRAVLMAAAQRLPASDERVARSFAGARGDLMRGFAMGLDWLGEALTDDQIRTVQQTSAEYIRVILKERHAPRTWWVPYHNFMGVSLGAAGCLAIRLRDACPAEAPAWIDLCAAGVGLWLDQGFDEQGAYVEGTGYAHYGLSNAILFAHALQRHGGADLFASPRLRQVPQFFAQSLLPGEGVFDARNDANYAGLSDPFMLRLATAHHSGLAAWLWQRCGSPGSALGLLWPMAVPPQEPGVAGVPLAEHFMGRGLCVFRTGWARDDVMFAMEAGPYRAVTHNQADKGHFTLYGLGQRWAIDSGYGNNRLPGGRDQTVAHNAVLVDDVGQALCGAGAGTTGRILRFADTLRYGYALCDATEAYNLNDKGQPGATVHHALRHSLFVRPFQDAPAYAVVMDDIRRDEAPHAYTWLLHTDAANEVVTDAGGAVLAPATASGGAYVETPDGAAGQGACAWEFTLAAPADLVLWARVRSGGPIAAKSDSFFVQMDEGALVEWHMPGVRQWTWSRAAHGVAQAPTSFALSAGTHRLRFLTREPGAQLDAVLLTPDTTLAPPFGHLPGSAIRLEAEAAQLAAPMRGVRGEPGQVARLRVRLTAAAPAELAVDDYDGHPRLKATVTAVAPEFAVVLMPLPGLCPEPGVDFARTEAGLGIAVHWPTHVDRILWPAGGERTPSLLGE